MHHFSERFFSLPAAERGLFLAAGIWVVGVFLFSLFTVFNPSLLSIVALWAGGGLLIVGYAQWYIIEQLQAWCNSLHQELLASVSQQTPQQMQPAQTIPSAPVAQYDRDGVAIQFHEIFKEL